MGGYGQLSSGPKFRMTLGFLKFYTPNETKNK